MNKKAFSLIELSTILVIIGTILVIVIKGKEVAANAGIKKDISTLMLIQGAVHQYLETGERSSLTTNGTSEDIRIQPFISDQLLTKDNLYSSTSKADWELYHCVSHNCTYTSTYPYKTSGPFGIGYYKTTVGDNICAGMGRIDNSSPRMSTRLLCNIEKALDDEKILEGFGRETNSQTIMLSSDEMKDCTRIEATRRSPYAYRVYGLIGDDLCDIF